MSPPKSHPLRFCHRVCGGCPLPVPLFLGGELVVHWRLVQISFIAVGTALRSARHEPFACAVAPRGPRRSSLSSIEERCDCQSARAGKGRAPSFRPFAARSAPSCGAAPKYSRTARLPFPFYLSAGLYARGFLHDRSATLRGSRSRGCGRMNRFSGSHPRRHSSNDHTLFQAVMYSRCGGAWPVRQVAATGFYLGSSTHRRAHRSRICGAAGSPQSDLAVRLVCSSDSAAPSSELLTSFAG